MLESITPPAVPEMYIIPVDALYSGLRFLFADVADVDNNQNDAQAFAEVFRSTAIHLVQKSFAYQNVELTTMAILHQYGIPFEKFVTLMSSVWTIIATPIEQIERAIEMLRYHFIVDVNYKLTDNRTLQVSLIKTLPSRNYSAILKAEVLEAQAKGEFVPYKYLILAGLA